MRKLSQINEGLWSKGIDRSKSGEKRTEDITPFDKYIPQINWVDLGHPDILFAELDFSVLTENGNDLLSINDIKQIIKSLPKDISIMTSDQYNWLKQEQGLEKSNIRPVKTKRKQNSFINRKNLNRTCFDIHVTGDYFLGFETAEVTGGIAIKELIVLSSMVRFNIVDDDKLDRKQYLIKLVKNKHVNEGLWLKGIERSKSGDERIEDKINSNIKELKPIDIGLTFMFSDDYLIIEDKDRFTYEDLKTYKKFIKKHGWRIPTYKELKNNLFNEDSELFSDYKLNIKRKGTDYFAYLSTSKNNNVVIFKLSSRHGDNFWTSSNMYVNIFHSTSRTEFQYWRSDCNCRLKIRLVKDK